VVVEENEEEKEEEEVAQIVFLMEYQLKSLSLNISINQERSKPF